MSSATFAPRSRNISAVVCTACVSSARRSTSVSCHSAWPDSIFAMSSTWLTSRLRRSVSATMMPRNCWRCSASMSGVVEHQLGQRADRGQRRAQLVRHRRHEVVLQPVEALAAARWRRAARRSRARASATSPPARANARAAAKPRRGCASRRRARAPPPRPPRRPSRAPRRCRSRRRAASRRTAPAARRPGSDRLARRRCCARSRRTAAARARRAEEAGRQRQQVVHPRAAAPEHRPAGRLRALEHVDEEQRLARLARRRRAPQRHRTYAPTLDEQAPEQRMRQVVEPAEAEATARASAARCRTGRARGSRPASQPDLAIDGSISV